MDTRIREVQPMEVDARLGYQANLQDSQLIPPVAKGGRAVKPKLEGEEQSRSGSGKMSPGPQKTKDMVEEVQQYLDDINIRLSFKISETSDELVVQVLNRDTGDVIRQFPPEELIKLREKLEELRGVLFNGKV